MSGQDEFFSPQHKRLLRIAVSARYLAWCALVVAFLLPMARFIILKNTYINGTYLYDPALDFVKAMWTNPAYAASAFVETLQSFLNGFIGFLLLLGLSLGLNMIVETDVNYREARREGGAQ